MWEKIKDLLEYNLCWIHLVIHDGIHMGKFIK